MRDRRGDRHDAISSAQFTDSCNALEVATDDPVSREKFAHARGVFP